MQQLHFLGGMPRSGSTLLASLLQQNPQVYATGTDPLPGIIHSHILQAARYTEAVQAMSVSQSDKAFYGLCVQGAKGWYESLTTRPVVFSKSRLWGNVHSLFPNSKMVFIIRDLRDIVESFDKVNASSVALSSVSDSGRLYNSMTEEEKFNYYFKDSTYSFGYSLFHELPKWLHLETENPGRVMWLRYEDLVSSPQNALDSLYAFLGLTSFTHRFSNIEPLHWEEWDNAYFNEKTSHTVKKDLRTFFPDRTQLSKKFHDRILTEYSYYYDRFYS